MESYDIISYQRWRARTLRQGEVVHPGVWVCGSVCGVWVWEGVMGYMHVNKIILQYNIIVEIFRLSNEDFTNYAAPGRISWMLPVCYCESC